jgi:hypothetical protein
MIRSFASAECQLPALILARAYGPFGVVARILNTLHDFSLVCLLCFGEFFNALLVNLRDLRKPLGITRLPGAVRTRFLRDTPKFFDLDLVLPHVTFRHEYLPLGFSLPLPEGKEYY